MVSDKKRLQVNLPHQRNTCRISLVLTLQGRAWGLGRISQERAETDL